MYNFTDMKDEWGTLSTSMSIQTIFNDINLDEELTDYNGSFRTLTVGGRGILPRRMRTTQTPGMNGEREGSYTYDVRMIPVKFQLTDRTNEGFRERFTRLNGLLLGSEKRLKFTDESAYFTATLENADLPEEESNTMIGTLNFYCSDPSKNKNKHILSVDSTYQSFKINGQAETPWTSETIFTEPTNQYTLETKTGGLILLDYNFIPGDVLEIDYHKRKVTLNGNLLMVAVNLSTDWRKLQPGFIQMRTSHETLLSYSEKYY